MQAVGATLPKFETLRPHSVSAPMWWEWNFLARESFRQFCQPRIQHAACINDLALMRNPRAQLAANRSRMTITNRFLPRAFFSHPIDSNLSLQLLPEDVQTGACTL